MKHLRHYFVGVSFTRVALQRSAALGTMKYHRHELWAGEVLSPATYVPETLTSCLCRRDTFADLRGRFMQLYQRQAMLHHYTKVRTRLF